MKTMKITLSCVAVLLSVTQISCRQENKEVTMAMLQKELDTMVPVSKVENTEDTVVVKGYTEDECNKILDEIVRKSEFNKFYMPKHPNGYVIETSEITTGKTILELRKIEKNKTIPDGWFELDATKNKLFLNSGHSKVPMEIKFKQELLNEFKTHCMQLAVE